MAFSDHDLDDREFPDDEDDEDLDESDTRDCPECGASVYQDVEQCPSCGCWITAETSPWSGRTGWWIALGIAGVIAVILALSVGVP
jgi:hypothetical protein